MLKSKNEKPAKEDKIKQEKIHKKRCPGCGCLEGALHNPGCSLLVKPKPKEPEILECYASIDFDSRTDLVKYLNDSLKNIDVKIIYLEKNISGVYKTILFIKKV